MDKTHLEAVFRKYCQKLRITPPWDVKLEFVDDPAWTKTGDFKIDCDPAAQRRQPEAGKSRRGHRP